MRVERPSQAAGAPPQDARVEEVYNMCDVTGPCTYSAHHVPRRSRRSCHPKCHASSSSGRRLRWQTIGAASLQPLRNTTRASSGRGGSQATECYDHATQASSSHGGGRVTQAFFFLAGKCETSVATNLGSRRAAGVCGRAAGPSSSHVTRTSAVYGAAASRCCHTGGREA